MHYESGRSGGSGSGLWIKIHPSARLRGEAAWSVGTTPGEAEQYLQEFQLR